MTLDDAVSTYRAEMRRAMFSKNAIDRYGRQLERFAEHVGAATPIREVGPAECRGGAATDLDLGRAA